jgi:hypothetical protein
MGVKFNPFTGNLDLVGAAAGGGGTPGGADTQVQFNDDGSFGGSADFTWDDTGKVLDVGGDINLDDGGSFQTTLQLVTPTAARTITFPDATGTVGLVAGSTGQLVFNNAGAYSGLSGVTTDGTDITLTGRFISSLNGAASAPPGTFTGTWFTGGTATTTKPQVLIEPTGTTSTAWSTSGTGLGVNAASGFAGNLLDLQVNGSSYYRQSGTSVRWTLANGRFMELDSNCNLSWGGTAIGGISGSATIICGLLLPSQIAQNNNNLAFTIRGAVQGSSRGSSLTLTGDGNALAGAFQLVGGQIPADTTTGNSLIRGVTAFATATTHISGGALQIEGGYGASSSASTANGGNVNLDGGIGYGTGTNGNIIIGATRGNLQITDARDVILGTTTGTKIGTATTQKLGFYNATPVVQPAAVADITTTATAGTLPTPDGSVTIADADAPHAELLEYCVELEAKLEAALGHLRTLGLIAT